MEKRVMITGHRGYIGSVMTPMFLEAGYSVAGLDSGYYDECTLVPDSAEVPSLRKDIRDLNAQDLKNFHAVIHLAALSNDPLGDLDSGWTEEINFRASVRLAELAKAAGVRRFILSSSCIMYGMSEANVVSEDSPIDPKTEYARSKIKAERAISRLASDEFSPTFLRNGTVYGISPRMRFDTVFNNLIGSAVATGKIIIYSNGKPWRPVVHVQDLSRAFLKVLEAPLDDVHNEAFNNGVDHLNHQIIELGEVAVRTVPGCKLEVLAQPSVDQRTYKTDFRKFARVFPDFDFRWTIEEGAKELHDALKAIGLTNQDFVDRRFTRLKWLSYLLDTGKLDNTLRWRVRECGVGS
ncbi:MAG: NAD-dependent epimerase/dehydratase family protein [Candidatus Binatia bacterium]